MRVRILCSSMFVKYGAVRQSAHISEQSHARARKDVSIDLMTGTIRVVHVHALFMLICICACMCLYDVQVHLIVIRSLFAWNESILLEQVAHPISKTSSLGQSMHAKG
jgi:hypothetical protein